ncbi:MAG: MgtC/SapB family protein [Thermoplasmata archaeon]
MDYSYLLGLSTAVFIGLLIGLERKYAAAGEGKQAAAAVWVFMLLGFIGFLTFFTGTHVVLLVFSLILIFSIPIFKFLKGGMGMTTVGSLVVVFLLGFLCGNGMYLESVFLAFLTLSILSVKSYTRLLSGIVSSKEMEGFLEFVAITIVLLPLTYLLGDVNQYIGPGRLFDPFKTVLMVVFVSSLSFISFIIMKVTDTARGLKISSFLAGFVNSAACTASLAQRSSKDPVLRTAAQKGVVLTNTSMIIKDIIIISVIAGTNLARLLLLPVAILTGISLSALYKSKGKDVFQGRVNIKVKNPFAILPALKFGLLFILISSLSHVSVSFFGDQGVYASSFAGLISTTSVSASVGVLQSTGIVGSYAAASTVLLALALGSLFKVAISFSYDKELGKKVALPMFILAAAASLMVMWCL